MNLKLISFIILFSISNLGFSQSRYIDEVFTEVSVTHDVNYGINGSILYLYVNGEAVPDSLFMDIYEPVQDLQDNRPLVLVFHSGYYLPPIINGTIAGTRKDSSVVEICTQLARRGFVACSVDYRLGWNPLASAQVERAIGLIQALYRSVQDGRNAIRFMKAHANLYRIDEDKITMWGNNTGAYLVLGTASLDQYEEIINTTHDPGKFLFDLDGDGIPDTPMVIPEIHGDVEGKDLTIISDNPVSQIFGFPIGDTTNYVNYPDESSDYALTVNIGGAIGDISWLDDNCQPIISIQSPDDGYTPYIDSGLWVFPGAEPIVRMQGGLTIARKQEELGNNDGFADGIFDDPITQLAKNNSALAGHEYVEGLFPWVKDPNSNGYDEGVVMNWWDPDGLLTFQSDTGIVTAPINMIPHPSGQTFHDISLILNEGMSAEKARANIADIMDYVIPRACLALALPECDYLFTGTEDVLEDDSFLTISPNPVSDKMTIESTSELIQSVEVNNTNGQLVFKNSNVNARTFTVDRISIGTGMFVVKTAFENGVSARKVMVK